MAVLCRNGWPDQLFSFMHRCEIKGILEKKAALAKLSFPGKCCMEKLIVRGVGIQDFPTDCLSSPGQAASSLSSGKGDKH